MLESPPFDQVADRVGRSERSPGPGWLQPFGLAFEDSFEGAWRHGLEDLEDRAIPVDFNPPQRGMATLGLPTKHEETLASGEYKSTSTSPDDDEIVVIGHRYVFDQAAWVEMRNDPNSDPESGLGHFGDGGDGGVPLSDEASIDIDLSNINRPLTASEATAIENLKNTIAAITAAINALANNAILTLPNGATVTGAELKDIWAKTDFVIRDDFSFDNGGGGEAKMWYGEPTISFNVQYLDRYDHPDLRGGMNYVVAHELGHLSQAGDSFLYTDQRTANDIGRALLNGAGLEYLANPTYGYTEDAPMQFSGG